MHRNSYKNLIDDFILTCAYTGASYLVISVGTLYNITRFPINVNIIIQNTLSGLILDHKKPQTRGETILTTPLKKPSNPNQLPIYSRGTKSTAIAS